MKKFNRRELFQLIAAAIAAPAVAKLAPGRDGLSIKGLGIRIIRTYNPAPPGGLFKPALPVFAQYRAGILRPAFVFHKYAFTWKTDELVKCQQATPQEIAAYAARAKVGSSMRVRMPAR